MKLRQTVLAGALAISLFAPGAASADVITDTTGVEINQTTPTKLSYALAVSDLTTNDYKVVVTKSDDQRSSDDATKTTTDIGGGGQISGGWNYKYIITIELTDSGKAKVAAETGVTDPEQVQVYAGIPSNEHKGELEYTFTTGTNSPTPPAIATPVAIATKTSKTVAVSSTADLKSRIVDAKAAQDATQAKHPISTSAEKIITKAHITLSAGASVSKVKVNQKTLHRQMAYDKKAYAKVERQKAMQKYAAIGWRVLGVVLVMLAGAGVGLVAYKIQKNKKGK